MSDRLAGKVCIITGTGGSMGREAALMFAREGALVVGCGLNADAEETAQLVRDAGGTMVSLQPCDLTKPTDCRALVDLAVQTFGRIDVLFNNAAMAYFNWIEDITDEEWDRNRREEVDLVFYLTRAAWPHLKTSRGVLVNTASLNALMSFKGHPSLAHTTAKAGIIGMTRQLAMEGREHGIRANSISPGFVDSPATRDAVNAELREWMVSRHLIQRPGTGTDIAGCAVYLASDESSWVTGQNFSVDGGWSAGFR